MRFIQILVGFLMVPLAIAAIVIPAWLAGIYKGNVSYFYVGLASFVAVLIITGIALYLWNEAR